MYDFSISKLVLIFIILISNFSKFLVKFQTSWRSIIVIFIISSLDNLPALLPIITHAVDIHLQSLKMIMYFLLKFVNSTKFNTISILNKFTNFSVVAQCQRFLNKDAYYLNIVYLLRCSSYEKVFLAKCVGNSFLHPYAGTVRRRHGMHDTRVTQLNLWTQTE